ncbi:MAG TPA: LPS export ABC transporter permease LptG, partial [Novosphingobium sp.]|nr:LPS export ABC transporter permease LptG [Novosphingobium sp.]
LLATIFVLAGLNQNSEVIAMKAAGLSAHQVLAPLVLAAFAVSVVSFAFNERVVTRSTATLKAWSGANYGPVPKDASARANIYLRDGPNILQAATLSGTGENTVLNGVTWYARDQNGMVTRQVRSPTARWTAQGWRLDDPVAFEVATTRTERIAPITVAARTTPADLAMSKVDADALDAVSLYYAIRQLKEAGRRTSELEAKWWHKFSGPLAAMLMPLLGAIAAFGLARSGALLVRSIIGMALGFAYFVVDNAALAMGDFGGYPPLIAAWAPFVLFALVGETVLVRTEE